MKKTFLLAAAFLVMGTPAKARKKVSKPNVVVILMDDLGLNEIGCYGQKKIETPHIDRLCSEGMRFSQSYSGSPVSAPARCVMLTGMHSGHAQIRHNNELAARGDINSHQAMFDNPSLEGQAPLKAGTMTIGRLMQQAGYTTGCFGKWGLGYPGSEGTPNKQGFDTFYGYNCQRQAHNPFPAFLYRNEQRETLNPKVTNPHEFRLAPEDDPRDEANFRGYFQENFAHDFIFRELTSFVEENHGRPFFAMFTTPLPHVPLCAPQRWVDYYVKKFGDENPYLGNAGYGVCRYPHATYAAMVSYFDEQVGQLVDQLKRLGIYDNTLIIFTSDNGPTFNGGSDSPWFDSAAPFKSENGWGKCYMHEGGIRIPMIAVWKNHIAAGSLSGHVTSFQDFMPTLAELTGSKCPATDGISFLPTLLGKNKKQKKHEYLYWEYPDPRIGNKAVLKGQWKGILTNINNGNTHIELFNLDTDPRELNDVSEQHPEIVAEFERIMDESHSDYSPATK